MQERLVKAGWHALMATVAIVELRSSRSLFRKLLCGAAAGWHATAAVQDLKDHAKTDGTETEIDRS